MRRKVGLKKKFDKNGETTISWSRKRFRFGNTPFLKTGGGSFSTKKKGSNGRGNSLLRVRSW